MFDGKSNRNQRFVRELDEVGIHVCWFRGGLIRVEHVHAVATRCVCRAAGKGLDARAKPRQLVGMPRV